MDEHIDIKDEPVWPIKQELCDFVPNVETEIRVVPEHGEVRGTDQIAASSYSAAINLTHGTKVKEERQAETEFGFVDVGVDGVPASDPSCVPEEDPLRVSSGVPCPAVWPPPLDGTKTELPSWTESEHARHRPDNDMLSSSLPGGLAACLVPGMPYAEGSSKPETDESAEANHNTETKTLVFVDSSSEVQGKAEKDEAVSEFCLQAGLSRVRQLRNSLKYTCDTCGVKLTSRLAMKQHVQLHVSGTHKVFHLPASRSFTEPKQLHTGEKPCACDVCDAKVAAKSNLTEHKRRHVGEKTYAYDVCDSKFASSSNLTEHKQYHTGEKPYACDMCGGRFTRNDSLTVYKQLHTGKKRYACDVCEVSFSLKDDVTRHKRKNSSLTKHKRLHTGEKPYACDMCDARFTRSYHLTRHKRCHTGDKPYACDMCDARFTRHNSLTEHKRLHTGLKPYACNVCDARFTRSDYLTRHKRCHTGEKPYACDKCDAKFALKSTLTAHKRIHTGEKPYACNMCDARFTRSSAVTKHKRRHARAKSYMCDVCGAKFVLNVNLRKHKKRLHTR